MPLSEPEQRLLEGIQANLEKRDPGFVQKFRGRCNKLPNSPAAREERQMWKITLWGILIALVVIAVGTALVMMFYHRTMPATPPYGLGG